MSKCHDTELLRTFDFLMTLRAKFELVCSQLFNRDSIPSLDVVQAILAEEIRLRSLNLTWTSTPIEIVLAITTNASTFRLPRMP